ncbi:alanine racemase [Arenibacter sp. 6A1]|uniref:alanine racemase n=1 Tax=Arenibacter sp. 6A1 TaxID=2720391 RepID=UPI001446B92B|nr:alanine racemase [Arenibacter sp. 6A1]NKI26580.1 alanine racemase [Arenibacter sp. 6A1]
MSNAGETVLEIDLKALEHNYQYLKTKIKSNTKFLGVVKAFAYGSDSVAIAKKLEALGADYLAVAYTSEGVTLRSAGIKMPILVLHPQQVSFATMIENSLEPSLYSLAIFTAFIETANKLGASKYPIHLKFNTGLNRIGFEKKDIDFIVDHLKKNNALELRSIFSHLAASEDLEEKDFTLQQIHKFEEISKDLETKLGNMPMRHLLNTSGIINYADAQYDMVRSGIGIYGFGNEASEDKKLRPVASLKTIISQIHTINAKDTVGYNRAFTAEKTTVTATLPLGHADGLGRQYGNKAGQVLVHGKLAPIIGNVCMDMVMIDITDIPCKEGDEVIVFGKEYTADWLATSANTISYELLTGISQRVKRTYID